MQSVPCHRRVRLSFVLLLSCLDPGATGLLHGQERVPPDRPGPWDNALGLFASDDGVRFERRGTLVERGGVATVVADKSGRLAAAFQWFPLHRPEAFDRVAVAFSEDDGRTWSPPEPIAVEGLPAGYRRPFDPTLTVLRDGRYRLYFTSHAGEAADAPRDSQAMPGIFSATSTDAVHYHFDGGARFAVAGERVIDCAVAWLGEECHLFAPVQGKPGVAYHAVARDGLEFRRLPDLELDVEGSWLGCALAVDGGLRFFGTGAGGWSATSADGRTWRLDGERGAGQAPRHSGADPGVARTRDGRYVMVATVGGDGPGPADELPRQLREAGRPGSQPVLFANNHSVYVLRGTTLYRFDAQSLELMATARLPDAGPEERRREAGAERRPAEPRREERRTERR